LLVRGLVPRNSAAEQAMTETNAVRQDSDGGGARRRFLQRAAWLCGAMFGSNMAAAAAAGAAETARGAGSTMINDMTADDVLKLLKLEPNATCGFVRETYRAQPADRAGRIAGAVRRRPPAGLGAVLHGDAAGAGAAAPDPQ
jgi:hypothetical protein